MRDYQFGTQTYAIFDTNAQGRLWLVHFIWGKKDFRISLSHLSDDPKPLQAEPILLNSAGEEMVVTRLQYCHAFQWYDYIKVAGHGLEYEETLWQRSQQRRYVELPRDFYAAAVKLACLEFSLVTEAESK